MKILFILENTIDDLHGGTEVSSFHLTSLLRKKNCEVTEWTPFFKRKPQFWYTSLIGQAYIFTKLILYLLKNKQDVIHVQGKYLIPPAVVAGKILKISTVVTIRDYIVICPAGLCLFEEGVKKINHDFGWYLMKEIPKFLSIYHPKDTPMIRIIRVSFLIRGWWVAKYLKWWLKQADEVVAVSLAVQRILDDNGIKSRVIYNTFDIGFYKNYFSLSKNNSLRKDKKIILFVGKTSYGKGYDLFLSLSQNKGLGDYKFKTIGGKSKLDYLATLREIKQALVVVVPSRWPEPFGRVALESLMAGVPVLTTNKGGLPEIVEDGIFGYVYGPGLKQLTIGLRKTIRNNVILRQNIRKQIKILENKFRDDPVTAYLGLYNEII